MLTPFWLQVEEKAWLVTTNLNECEVASEMVSRGDEAVRVDKGNIEIGKNGGHWCWCSA